ncbi:hypothetical protein MMC12_007232 [Toensbergia leucococca]|nr:hypothetical protein [Toensbergia leucococca]
MSRISIRFGNRSEDPEEESYVAEDQTEPNSEVTSDEGQRSSFCVPSKGVQELMGRFKVQLSGEQDPNSLDYSDVGTFLTGEKSVRWDFPQDHKFNSIFRRHLEHILSICLIHVHGRSGRELCTVFVNHSTFNSLSTPVSDFFIFRYLLLMYHLLRTDTFTRSSSTSALQDRIEKACKETRGKKSKLWYQDTTSSYVVWEGRRDKELEWLKDELKLPEYRLGDHVDLWKALKSLEEMIEDVKNEEVTLDPVLDRLEESGLQHDFLRTTILQRFLCENADTRLNDLSLHETTTHQDNPPNLPASVNGSFAITVSRSRMNDRLLFYAKDTMLYDGLKWGFFKKGPKIETLDAQNKKVEADVQLSWKNTVQIQGIDQEAIWETPLRYALALCMAELGQSLDATKAPTEIADISWKNILRGIWPSGLFAPKVDRNTKRPDF